MWTLCLSFYPYRSLNRIMQEGEERDRDFKKILNRLKNVAIETDSDTIKIASCIVDIVLSRSAILSD